MARQNELQKMVKNDDSPVQNARNPVEEIKNYKELLDMGAITEEEYNLKKSELLKL